MHEHVRWFEQPARLEVEMRARRRVAVAGAGEALERVLDKLVESPELEPFVLLRPVSEPVPGLGDVPQAAGLRAYVVGERASAAACRRRW